MPDLNVIGHYPNINEKDVLRNTRVEITFDKVLSVNSITNSSVIVTDSQYIPVNGTVSHKYNTSGEIDTVVFTPEGYMLPGVKYLVTISKHPNSVIAKTGEYLTRSYKFNFTTGSQIAEDVPVDEIEAVEQLLNKAVEDGNYCKALKIKSEITGEPSECILSDIKEILYNSIVKTFPKNKESNISLDQLPFIHIEFSEKLDTSVDFDMFVSINITDVLG